MYIHRKPDRVGSAAACARWASAEGPAPAPAGEELTIPTSADSDSLSVHTAVVGLIAAMNRTALDLNKLNPCPGGKTDALNSLLKEINFFKLTMLLLHKYLRRVELGMLERPERAALVNVDVIIVVLTACVMTVSEMESRLKQLVREAQGIDVSPADMCHRYARRLAKDANRISMVDFIITKLLSVLQE